MLPHLHSFMGSLGTKHLPVFEMPLSVVRKTRLADGPDWGELTLKRRDLTFTGTQLAHAVIKTDYLRHRNPMLPGIAFVLQSHHVLDWQRSDVCLRPGGSVLLSDFARTSMTGRVGQGLAILFSHRQGYAFTAHLRDYLESNGISTRSSAGRLEPVADFVCDGSGSNRAIVESKASFSDKCDDASAVKGALKQALEKQVAPWMSRIHPVANKSFVVSSYLRESAPGWGPSALVFVDPEGDTDQGEVSLPAAAVRRENYAAWLTAMGLIGAAERLRRAVVSDLESVGFAVFNFSGHEFAFPHPFDAMHFTGWRPSAPVGRSYLAAGIHLDALHAVSRATHGSDAELLAYGSNGFDLLGTEGGGAARFSLFPDGTFLGTIDSGRFVGFREFEL